MANGLFGSSDAVRAALAQQRLGNAQLIGNLGPGGLGALGGLMAGEGVGQLFGGVNPALRRAQKLEQIGADMEAAGLEPDNPDFAREVYRRMISGGFSQQEALAAFQQAQQATSGAIDLERKANPVDRRGNLARSLVALGEDPEVAMILSQTPKAAMERIKVLAKPEKEDKGTTDQQNFAAAQRDPAFAEYLEAKRRQGATRVRVENFYGKPLGKDARDYVDAQGNQPSPDMTASDAAAEGFRPMTRAEEAAATEQARKAVGEGKEREEVRGAVAQLNRVLSEASAADVANPFSSARDRYKLAAGRLAKAEAQRRNPGDAEAAGQAEDRILEQMPSFEMAVMQPNRVRAVVNDVLSAATGDDVKARADALIKKMEPK